jgi:phosphatidate cytidylyltransferase
MAKRVVTAVLGLPFLILFVSLGGLWLRSALLALSLIGLYEFYRALSKKVLSIHFSGYFFAILYFMLVIDYGAHAYLLVMLSAFILLTFSLLVIFYRKITLQDCLVTIGGFFYIPFLLSFIYFVREDNIYFVWLIFISASSSDTFAYIVGRAFGRHKLSSTPSPGKTLEGCIGGVLGAALIGFLYGHFAIYLTGVTYPIVLNSMAISIMGAVFSHLTSLLFSILKPKGAVPPIC